MWYICDFPPFRDRAIAFVYSILLTARPPQPNTVGVECVLRPSCSYYFYPLRVFRRVDESLWSGRT